jgi:hypothetical protein
VHFDHQNQISRTDSDGDAFAALRAFVELHPELFQVYIGLVDEALSVEEQLRSAAESQYKETMLRAQRAADAATAGAWDAYRQATDSENRQYRERARSLQVQLNSDIDAANRLFQQSEKPARFGVNERFAAIERQRTTMQFAAVELSLPALMTRAESEYQAARAALIAEIDAALAPARAVYDADIKAMHERYQADLRALDSEQSAFDAPYIAERNRAIEAIRATYALASSQAYMARHHAVEAIDRRVCQMKDERLAQIEAIHRRSL